MLIAVAMLVLRVDGRCDAERDASCDRGKNRRDCRDFSHDTEKVRSGYALGRWPEGESPADLYRRSPAAQKLSPSAVSARRDGGARGRGARSVNVAPLLLTTEVRADRNSIQPTIATGTPIPIMMRPLRSCRRPRSSSQVPPRLNPPNPTNVTPAPAASKPTPSNRLVREP